jgi:hypothetical protein
MHPIRRLVSNQGNDSVVLNGDGRISRYHHRHRLRITNVKIPKWLKGTL